MYDVLTLSAADLDYVETQRFAADQVSKVFAVPAHMLLQGSVRNEGLDSDDQATALDRLNSPDEA